MQPGIAERLALAPPLSPDRILIFGGILLAMAGMLFGEIYAIFHFHQSAMSIEREMLAGVRAVATRRPEALASPMATIGKMLESMGTKKDTHTHWIQLAYLCLILSLIQPYIALSPDWKGRWATVMVASSLLLPLGVFTIYYIGVWGSIIADTAGAFIIAALAAEWVGARRFFRGGIEPKPGDPDPAERKPVNKEPPDPARSFLLGWGMVLISAGLLHGAYYAAFGLYQNEDRETTLLRTSLNEAMAGNLDAAEQVVRDYNGLQAEKAIYVATHTHLIEFGILAVLLAFAQRFVFLSAPWKLRWARLLVAGGFLLPLAVQAEIEWGLLAGAVADLGGMLVVIALSGMLAGICRYTGAVDARSVPA